MVLPASGPITHSQIAAEFGIAASSSFPTAFYGLGGAPGSGALKYSDFYGRSGALPISADHSPASASGYGASDTVTITTTGGRTITSITLMSGATGGRVTLGATGGASTTITITTPGTGTGTVNGVYRVTCSTGEWVEVPFDGTWGFA